MAFEINKIHSVSRRLNKCLGPFQTISVLVPNHNLSFESIFFLRGIYFGYFFLRVDGRQVAGATTTACLCCRGKLATHAARSGKSNAFDSNCSINYSEGETFLATHTEISLKF